MVSQQFSAHFCKWRLRSRFTTSNLSGDRRGAAGNLQAEEEARTAVGARECLLLAKFDGYSTINSTILRPEVVEHAAELEKHIQDNKYLRMCL